MSPKKSKVTLLRLSIKFTKKDSDNGHNNKQKLMVICFP